MDDQSHLSAAGCSRGRRSSLDELEQIGSASAKVWPAGALCAFLRRLNVRGGAASSTSSDASLFLLGEECILLSSSSSASSPALNLEGVLWRLSEGASEMFSQMTRFFALVFSFFALVFFPTSFFILAGTTQGSSVKSLSSSGPLGSTGNGAGDLMVRVSTC